MGFAVPSDHWVKLKESEKRDEYLNLARELKKAMKYESDGDTNCNWCTWNNPQSADQGTRRLRNHSTSKDHPNYCITKIEKNTEKSPGNLRRFAVTHTLVRNHQLTLVGKTLKGGK